MLMLFPSLFVFPVHFPSLFSQKKISISLFIIIRHELCFPLTHNQLMKYLVYYSKNSSISLYLLSYEYMCANCLLFLSICFAL